MNILEKVGILETLSSGQIGIKGIDNKEYPIPSYTQIRERIKESQEHHEFLETKADQGFTKLLLVPFGMSLDALIEKYKEVIIKHHQEGKLLATKENQHDPDEQLELNANEPIWVWDQYSQADKEGKLVYYPTQFTENNHQGKTKQELLNEEKTGFHILLAEDFPNIPKEGKGKEIGTKHKRKQIEANKTPEEYLRMLQNYREYKGELGQTPEDRIIYAITHLEETNQVIDDYQGKGSISYQVGGWFPVSLGVPDVPDAYWFRVDQRAYLGRSTPRNRSEDIGASFSARV